MKTLAQRIVPLVLLAIALAGAPGHLCVVAAASEAAELRHGAPCADADRTAARCAADCLPVAGMFAAMTDAAWTPGAARVLVIADAPHPGWRGPPLTPPPRPDA